MRRRYSPQPLATRPRVSVVIPCFNYGHYLPDAVHSALDDSLDVEVVIVDDCSTDGSDQVARTLATRDPRIRLVCHERNLGHIATYNDGLAQTTGDFVALLSADDLLTPGSLARSAALLDAHPSVGLVYGFPAYFSGVPPVPRQRMTSWTVWPGQEWLRILVKRGRNPIISPEAVMRRSVMEAAGAYDPTLPHAGDMAMWMQAAMISNVGRINGADQAFYRVHHANMHATTHAGHLTDLVQRQQAFESVLAASAEPAANELLAHADRALAREALHLATKDVQCSPDEADELVDFALRCSPGIRRTWAWAGCQLRRAVVSRSLAGPLDAAIGTVWWKLRWRRWRRFGT